MEANCFSSLQRMAPLEQNTRFQSQNVPNRNTLPCDCSESLRQKPQQPGVLKSGARQ